MSGVLDGKGKRWNNIPVGNNPTAMPLDNSLNQDLHTAVQQHCILTQDLDDEDPRKFSTSTPKRTAEAYERIWKYVPSSERIIQDINKTYALMVRILENRGVMGYTTKPVLGVYVYL